MLVAGTASAETLYSVYAIQQKLMYSMPLMQVGTEINCELKGTVFKVIETKGWYIYVVGVDEKDADPALIYGYNNPCFLTLSETEYQRGDNLSVSGQVSIYFSSPMVPLVYPATVTTAPSYTNKATPAPTQTPAPVITETPSPTPTPFYMYYDQNNKDAVMELQSRLIELNYYEGEATGRFDWKTSQAITDFQTVNWMAQTGSADQNTLSRIFGNCVPNYMVYVTGDGYYHTTTSCAEVKNFKAMTIAQAMKQHYLYHDCTKE